MSLPKKFALPMVYLLLVACSSQGTLMSGETDLALTPDASATPEIVVEEATDLAIDRMKVIVEETYPVKVAVIVNGTLPDGCTSILRIKADYKNSEYVLKVLTRHDAGLECEVNPQAFEESVLLDVEELPAGTYNVSLNGLSESFTLDEDYEVPQSKSG